jgi:hypothetical protein
LTLLKLLAEFQGMLPSYTSDTAFFKWVDEKLLREEDGWRSAVVQVSAIRISETQPYIIGSGYTHRLVRMMCQGSQQGFQLCRQHFTTWKQASG